MKISKLILIFLVIFSCKISYSQDEFQVQENFKKIKFDSYIKVFRIPDSISPNYFIENTNLKWEENNVSYGFSSDFYWLRFTLKNLSSFKRNLYLEINNPHIKYIEFYELNSEGIVLNYHCGDHLPFKTRPIDSEKFIFPIRLEQGKSSTYYIKIDKRNTSVSFPTYLFDDKEFVKTNNNSKLFSGILFGGIMLCALYSIFAFFYIKKLLFLWYSLYAIFLGLYLFTTLGYSFQYLYPNNVIFTSFFRIVTLILGVIFLLKFTQSLLKTKLYIKKLHFIIEGIIYTLLFILLIWLIFPNFYKLYIALMVKVVYFFMLLSIISFILSAFLVYSKHKNIVKLYLFSFGALFLSGIMALLLEFGVGQEIRLNIPFLLIGALVQIIILGIGLFYEISLIYIEKKNLNIKIAQKQHEIVQAYIDGMEKERLRVSNELHDDIGSQLANFIRLVVHDNLLSNKFINKLKYIMEDVRRISHELTPANRTLLSFKEQLENLIEETFISKKIKCEFNFLGLNITLSEKQELNLYRILQEFLSNIAKHSKATLVEVQFISIENKLTITIEDNGIGFEKNQKHKGIGLLNIQKRVDYLNGDIEISSAEGVGTFVVIVIPLGD
jgi:signal transduction histidine kinase